MTDLTVDIVREFLDYNPETGIFRWKFRDRKHFTSDKGWKTWNGKNAGKNAGYLSKITCYYYIRIFGKLYGAHRLAWLHHYGDWPSDQIDHINNQRDDNRLENLREATNSQNQWNISIQSGRTSQYKGVSWHKRDNKWQAYISIDGKRKYLGYFISEEDAARVYDLAALKYFTEYANLNFPIKDYKTGD